MNKIKLLRSKLDMSQNKLAEEAKVGVVTIIRLENGGKAYPATLMKLAGALGVDFEELLEFEASGPYKGKAKPAPKPKEPPPEPVKVKFTGAVKNRAWDVSRELGFNTISRVKNFMLNNPELMDMPYEELKQAVAAKFKKTVNQ